MKNISQYEIKVGLIAGAILGLALFYLIEFMPILGFRIPSPDITSEYFRGVYAAIILLVVVFMLPCREGERIPLILIWGFRSLVTLFAMLFYEYNYGLDAYSYYSRAVNEQYIIDGSVNMLKGTHLIAQLGRWIVNAVPFFSSYHALKVIWSFLGFMGSYIFYRAYLNYTGRSDIRLLWLLGIFPSIIFWSSILGKDPITFFGISLAFYGSLPLFRRFSFRSVFIFILGLLIAGAIRSWLITIFFAPFALLFLFRSKANIYVKSAISAVCLTGLLYFSGDLLAQIQVDDQSDAINTVSKVSRAWSKGGSGQEVQEFKSLKDIVKFLPVGMFTALFRPMPGEVGNIFGIFAGFENFVLLLCVIYAFYKGGRGLREDLFVQYAIVTMLVWSAFYGFISYQNLGTAVRFKLQVMPLMILLPYHIWQNRRLSSASETA